MLVVLLTLLSGCSSNRHKADPIKVSLSQQQVNLVKITAEIQQQFDRALADLKQGKVDTALVGLKKLSANHPGISGVHLNLALIYFNQKNFELSRKEVALAIKASPRNAAAFNLSGVLFRAEGKFEAAREAYSKALLVDPGFSDAHLNLAILYDIYLQYWEDATEHYLAYAKLSNDNDTPIQSWLRDLEIRMKGGR